MENIMQAFFEDAALWMPRVGGVAVIFVVFFILAKIVKRIITRGAKRLKLDRNITSLLARTSSITLDVFAIVTVLGTLGAKVSALVAGLGLTGFAVGFAFKDTISNLLSGVLILVYRPFEIGNRIKRSGHEGTVVSIDLRYAALDSEGNKVLIPNSKLFTNPIIVLQ